MRGLYVSLIAASAAALLTGSAVVAAQQPKNDGASKAAKAIGGVFAPNARIAAFIGQGGTVFRSKGIAAVTHPSTGLYCIDPAGAGFNVNTAVPLTTVDWSTSLGDALMAQWRSSGIGCPAGWFAVLTFNGEDGTFDVSDTVAFTFVVP